jgi:hypothetical protein
MIFNQGATKLKSDRGEQLILDAKQDLNLQHSSYQEDALPLGDLLVSCSS